MAIATLRATPVISLSTMLRSSDADRRIIKQLNIKAGISSAEL
jgi:hypothetical protein